MFLGWLVKQEHIKTQTKDCFCCEAIALLNMGLFVSEVVFLSPVSCSEIKMIFVLMSWTHLEICDVDLKAVLVSTGQGTVRTLTNIRSGNFSLSFFSCTMFIKLLVKCVMCRIFIQPINDCVPPFFFFFFIQISLLWSSQAVTTDSGEKDTTSQLHEKWLEV